MITPIQKESKILAYACIVLLLFGGSYNLLRDNIKNASKTLNHRFIRGISNWGDAPQEISHYIKSRIEPKDYIYVVDYQPIIYLLSDSEIPTKYVFPPFLIGNESKKLLKDEHNRPDPEGTDDLFYLKLDEVISQSYIFEKEFYDVDLFRIKEKNFELQH
jgi:hypothetical protein